MSVCVPRQTTLLIALASACSASAQAQTPPDAGSLLQQIEKNAVPRRPTGTDFPKTTPAPEELRPAAGVTVTVTAFRFSGNRLLDDAALNAVVAPWLGRTLDLNELKKAATAVAEAYRARGWIVRAYLPKQDVTEGSVSIHIVEAVYGGATLDGKGPSRLKLSYVLSTIEAQQPRGQPLNGEALDRGLLLADDLPGVTVAGLLNPGPGEGETSLLLKLADEPLMTGEVAMDNTGSRSTGDQRVTLSANLNSPLGIGERVNASFIHTDGSDYSRLAATLPIGLDGLRAGVSASSLRYQLIAPEYQSLNAEGRSDTLGIDLSYPLLRQRMANVYLLANLDRKRFDNRANSFTTSHYQLNAASLGLSGNLIDNLGGGGASTASLTLSDGRIELAGNPTPRNDDSGGKFSKLRYAIARQQTLTSELSFYGSWTGQWANKNLDSAEKFYLGGASGVRAYPTSEGGGATGNLLTLELRQRLQENLSLVGFYDEGRVRQYRHNIDSHGNSLSGNEPNAYTLSGYGLTLAWLTPFGATLKATWARRLGNNPNPATSGANPGRDQDGTHSLDRIWLNANLPF